MMYLSIFFCILLLLFPKLFLFFYLIFRYFLGTGNNKFIDLIEFYIFSYFTLYMAVMIANRPYYIGVDIGFGEDMLHYYNAFFWVLNNDLITFYQLSGKPNYETC